MINEKKIAFITCVNDEKEYQESCWYLNRLEIPEGYSIDMLSVRQAESMTDGYQTAMQDSDAKYKVYLHQDVFIINQKFIEEMLKAFTENPDIGLLGCIGCEELPVNIQGAGEWDVGFVYHNSIPHCLKKRRHLDRTPYYVDAVDGLLLVTQYDVNWRTDLFDGWDFYDISQCFEIYRAGYKVAVPYQEQAWCYHDNTYSKMLKYQFYCQKFAEEYQDKKPFQFVQPSEWKKQFDIVKEDSRRQIMELVDYGEKEKVCEMFRIEENQGFQHLREFEVLAKIADMEKKHGEERFWSGDESFLELSERIRDIKFALIREIYAGEERDAGRNALFSNYSAYAIETIRDMYQLSID